MADARQESFASGELAPSLYGAFSLAAYAKGVRLARNWIITKYGTLMNRPGTLKIAATKNAASDEPRLETFDFSDNQTYLLEMGHLYIRIYKDGAQLRKPRFLTYNNQNNGYELFASDDYGDTWASVGSFVGQSGGKMTAHGNYYFMSYANDVYRSADGGATWVKVLEGDSLGIGAFSIYNMKSGGGVLAATISSGKIIYTTDDGLTWNSKQIPNFWFTHGIEFNGVTWMVGGNRTGDDYPIIAISQDLENWVSTLIASTTNFEIRAIHYIGSTWTIAGNTLVTGSYYSTDDGKTWKASTGIATGTADMIASIASNYTRMVAVGSGFGSVSIAGPAYYSDDFGVTWAACTGLPAKAHFGILFSQNVWVITGWEHIYKSTDGIAYTATATPTLTAKNITTTAFGFGNPNVLEIVTPYASSKLPKLRYTQSGDVLEIRSSTYSPRKLTRHGEYDWRFESSLIAVPPQTVANLAFDVAPNQVGDATHPIKEWDWVVSWLDEDRVESMPCAALAPAGSGKCALYDDIPVDLKWDVVPQAKGGYLVYRGRNKFRGYVGYVPQPPSTDLIAKFHDDGISPVPNISPRTWDRPFDSTENWPAVATYFENRFVQGGGVFGPATLGLSATDDWDNYDQPILRTEDDAFFRTLASRRFEEIRGLTELGDLLVFTSEAEWTLRGAQGTPISYKSVDARQQTHHGMAWQKPLTVGAEVLFVQSRGNEIRNFYKNGDGWQSDEVSTLVEHLFAGRQVVDWAFARRPFGIVWVILDDGTLLSFTYDRKQEIWAWARHNTYGGADLFKSVTTVTEAGLDVPYFVVQRANAKYVEKMTPRYGLASASDFCGLDSAVYYTGVAISTVTGLTHLIGRQVYGLGDGIVRGPVTVNGAGEAVFGGNTATKWYVGLQISTLIEFLDYPEGRTKAKFVNRAFVETSVEELAVDPDAGIYIGETEATADRIKFSNMIQGIIEAPVSRSTNPGARAVVKLLDPVPVEIRGFVREVEVGD